MFRAVRRFAGSCCDTTDQSTPVRSAIQVRWLASKAFSMSTQKTSSPAPMLLRARATAQAWESSSGATMAIIDRPPGLLADGLTRSRARAGARTPLSLFDAPTLAGIEAFEALRSSSNDTGFALRLWVDFRPAKVFKAKIS